MLQRPDLSLYIPHLRRLVTCRTARSPIPYIQSRRTTRNSLSMAEEEDNVNGAGPSSLGFSRAEIATVAHLGEAVAPSIGAAQGMSKTAMKKAAKRVSRVAFRTGVSPPDILMLNRPGWRMKTELRIVKAITQIKTDEPWVRGDVFENECVLDDL